MTRRLLSGLLVAAAFAGSAVADSMELEAVADAYTWEAEPSTNYGSASVLYVGFDGNGDFLRSLVLFDMSPVPAGANIYLGEFYLWSNIFHGTEYYHISCDNINSVWDEYSVTWNNAPEPYGDIEPADWPSGAAEWVVFDITSWVQEWHAGTMDNYGLLVYSVGQAGTCYCNMDSRESSDTDQRPKLVVSYVMSSLEASTWAGIKTSTY